MITLETLRLVLRWPNAGDLEGLAAMNADPQIMRFIGDGSIRTREQTEPGIALAQREWADRGYDMFSVDAVETGRFAGWVALTVPNFLPGVLPAVEIGWRLGREFWGQGLATEAARAGLRFGFTDCGLERIISIRHIGNEASRRVMEKLGMRFDSETVVPAHGQPVEPMPSREPNMRPVTGAR